MDLTALSLADLKSLGSDIAATIKLREADALNDARRQIADIARTTGMPLRELMAGAKSPKSGVKLPIKYRHPDNAAQVWTGRGRQPNWVVEALAQGRTKEELAA